MALTKKKPQTPSLRHTLLVNHSGILDTILPKNFIKKHCKGKIQKSGRNNQGRITVRRRGGGHKQRYRLIDFKRTSFQGKHSVYSIEYDPNRSSYIAVIGPVFSKNLLKKDKNSILLYLKTLDKKLFSYILAPKSLKVGDIVSNDNFKMEFPERYEFSTSPGSTLYLGNMPLGSLIHNIELKANFGGQIARAAGTYGQLIQKKGLIGQGGKARIRFPSGEHRWVPLHCTASLGVLSNESQNQQKLGKAGRSRWLGNRPKVRGVAMNPVDHPHGGGEGKTSGGRPSVTPWGRPTKGYITRSKKKKNSNIILKRKFA